MLVTVVNNLMSCVVQRADMDDANLLALLKRVSNILDHGRL